MRFGRAARVAAGTNNVAAPHVVAHFHRHRVGAQVRKLRVEAGRMAQYHGIAPVLGSVDHTDGVVFDVLNDFLDHTVGRGQHGLVVGVEISQRQAGALVGLAIGVGNGEVERCSPRALVRGAAVGVALRAAPRPQKGQRERHRALVRQPNAVGGVGVEVALGRVALHRREHQPAARPLAQQQHIQEQQRREAVGQRQRR